MATNLPDQEPTIAIVADGTVGPFSYDFWLEEEEDLKVYVAGTLKTLTTDYTIAASGLNNVAGGTITFVSGKEPSNGQEIVIVRDTLLERDSQFSTAAEQRSETYEADQTRFIAITQELRHRDDLAIHAPDYDTGSFVLPDADARASKLLGFDSSGNATTFGQNDSSAETVQYTGSTVARTHAERWRDMPHVRDYGATGTGSDDAPAFQKAIDEAASHGISAVHCDGGKWYWGTQILGKSGVSLVGGPTTPDPREAQAESGVSTDSSEIYDRNLRPFCMVYVDVGQGSTTEAAISFDNTDMAGMYGMGFAYPDQDRTLSSPILYGPTVSAIAARGFSMGEILAYNPYWFADMSIGGGNIDKVSLSPIWRGFTADQSLDVARFNNIHSWFHWFPQGNLEDFIRNNAIIFDLGDVDNWQFNNIFCFRSYAGFKLRESVQAPGKYSWIQATNCLGDQLTKGLFLLEQCDILTASNVIGVNRNDKGLYDNAAVLYTGTSVNEGARVNITGVDVYASKTIAHIRSANGFYNFSGFTGASGINSSSLTANRFNSSSSQNKHSIINEEDARVVINGLMREGVRDDICHISAGPNTVINGVALPDKLDDLADFLTTDVNDRSNWSSQARITSITNGLELDLDGSTVGATYTLPQILLDQAGPFYIEYEIETETTGDAAFDSGTNWDFKINDTVAPDTVWRHHESIWQENVPTKVKFKSLIFLPPRTDAAANVVLEFRGGELGGTGGTGVVRLTNIKFYSVDRKQVTQSLLDMYYDTWKWRNTYSEYAYLQFLGTSKKIYPVQFPTNGTWERGDRIELNSGFNTGAKEYECYYPGTFGTLGGSITADATSGSNDIVVSTTGDLRAGQYISVGSAIERSKIESIDGTTVTLEDDATTAASSASVAWVSPDFYATTPIVHNFSWNPPSVATDSFTDTAESVPAVFDDDLLFYDSTADGAITDSNHVLTMEITSSTVLTATLTNNDTVSAVDYGALQLVAYIHKKRS